jgi:hypothetical protein
MIRRGSDFVQPVICIVCSVQDTCGAEVNSDMQMACIAHTHNGGLI